MPGIYSIRLLLETEPDKAKEKCDLKRDETGKKTEALYRYLDKRHVNDPEREFPLV
jgi:hypothetical protein